MISTIVTVQLRGAMRFVNSNDSSIIKFNDFSGTDHFDDH